MNIQVAPDGFQEAINLSRTSGCAVHAAEEKILGISHCDSGRVLADKWHLAPCILDTIKYHHRFSQLSDYLPLVALVNISDRLCRIHGLG